MKESKAPPTKVQTVRLPMSLIHLMKKIASSEYRSLNAQIQMMLEDWLVRKKYMKPSERRKL